MVEIYEKYKSVITVSPICCTLDIILNYVFFTMYLFV